MGKDSEAVTNVRSFNRFYTNILGLLDQHILDSHFSLTEARILFELNEVGSCMAQTLSARLNIDKSYMSRMIGRFEDKGLIIKTVSSEDGRANYISLSDKGNDTIEALIQKSNNQIQNVLNALNDQECDDVLHAMDTIKKHFTKATTHLTIRPYDKSDIDYIISRQINLYKVEYGFTSDVWKAYVADGVHQLVNQFDTEKDCIHILEANGNVSGCIAITHTEQGAAQLRFFFIEPTLRRLGAGNKLMDKAIDFCRQKGYAHVFLWTFSELHAARYLYNKKGFHMTDTHSNTEWGEPVMEERWDLDL